MQVMLSGCLEPRLENILVLHVQVQECLHCLVHYHEKRISFRIIRREGCVLEGIRVVHTHLTHSFLFKKEDPLRCVQPLIVD